MPKIRTKTPKSFKGFETWLTSLLMTLKMYGYIFIFLLVFVLFPLFITLVYQFIDANKTQYFDEYLISGLKSSFFSESTIQFSFEGNPEAVYYAKDAHTTLREILQPEFNKIGWLFAGSVVITSLPFVFILRWFKGRSKVEAAQEHVRGTRVISPNEFEQTVQSDKEPVDITIGEIRLPVSIECKHAYFIGTTGTGKSVLLSHVIDRIRQRGDRAIIYDYKGNFVSQFYDPDRDVIFNPMDKRCANWNIFNEIRTSTDIDAVSHSLIPRSAKEDVVGYFNDAARDVLIGILHYLCKEDKRTNEHLWNAVSAPAREIHQYLSKTEAGKAGRKHIDDVSSKQALGILSTVMQYTSAFRMLSSISGDFSFTEWVRSGKEGWIFVVNSPDVRDTFRPVLSLVVDLVGREILCLPDDQNRRIFMLVDELGTLQRLSSLIDILTLARSKGGSVWLGTQDFGRISQLYGHDIAETIFNNCSTRICFRVNAPETASYLEKSFGEREISEVEESLSMGVDDFSDSISLGRRKKTEKVVLASEIFGLPDLSCFIKIGHYNVVKTKVLYRKYPDLHKIIDLRDDIQMSYGTADLKNIELTEDEVVSKVYQL